ncbi:MAG: ATP-dependent DNA helicase RecG [Candidatus Omnitrophota bacterium]
MDLKLDSPITHVKGVGTKYRQIFEKNGMCTVQDLLFHFPIFYIDFDSALTRPETGNKNLYVFEMVGRLSLSRSFHRRRFSVLRVSGRVGDEPVSVVFFNKPYVAELLNTHPKVYLYGEFDNKSGIWQSNTPLVLTRPESGSVVPVYAKIGTLKSGSLKNIMEAALEKLNDDSECLPPVCLDKYAFPGMVDALKAIHFPHAYCPEKIEALKKRFIYNEFFFFQMELQFIRNRFKRVPRQNRYPELGMEAIETLIRDRLGFALTDDQQAACRDIAADLSSDWCMQRLIQGDVGSGKTAVAFIALLLAAANGFQGAFLAPTELLAGQHFNGAQKFFTSQGIALLTGSTPAKKRKEILKGLESGAIQIVFGTHALLTEAVRFHHLGMVVIDEQHRFGVSQRAALYYKGHAVDLLVTTATPIPRTMLLSLYNDLSVSVIKTKPQGRLPIATRIIAPEDRDRFYLKLRKNLENNQKAYIILPLIEKSDFFAELRNIETESLYFKDMFKGIPMGVVSGRTPAAQKDEILEQLADGRIHVLLATTVIEVGIDVKDATLIVIENADRYGLAQLHQLRGRVGRGPLQSHCFLLPSSHMTESGKQRLSLIKETDDGFAIAEKDLKMRGGGIISGLEQSGFLDFKVGNLTDHLEVFRDARNDAVMILNDPSLITPYVQQFLDDVKTKLNAINFS